LAGIWELFNGAGCRLVLNISPHCRTGDFELIVQRNRQSEIYDALVAHRVDHDIDSEFVGGQTILHWIT